MKYIHGLTDTGAIAQGDEYHMFSPTSEQIGHLSYYTLCKLQDVTHGSNTEVFAMDLECRTLVLDSIGNFLRIEQCRDTSQTERKGDSV